MRHTEYVDEADTASPDYEVARDRTIETTSPLFSPLQILAILVGIGYAVLGVVAVNRTGFDTAHVHTPTTLVWHLPQNPLLAVIEIGFGLLMVVAAVPAGGSRSVLAFLSAVAVAFGIVVLVSDLPNRLHNWLAVTHRDGVVYIVSGGIVLLAALVAPVFGGTHRREVRRERTI